MTKFIITACIFLISAILSSCDVPQDHEWYERDWQTEEFKVGAIIEETENFKKSETSDGKKKYVFRTNDSKYIDNDTFCAWSITDSSTPYPSTVSATVSRQSGSNVAGHGILFAARKSGGKTYFLTVMINTSGMYMIGKHSAGNFNILQDWKRTDSLKKGYGVQNSIEVTVSGGIFRIYFNGVFTDSFQDTIAPVLSSGGAHGYIVTIPPTENLPQSFVEATFTE